MHKSIQKQMQKETDLVSAKPGTRSLRTTVPIFVVDMLDLREEDRLVWDIDPITRAVKISKKEASKE